MRCECGSDSWDGGRESRPREHGEEGSAKGGGGDSLKKRCLMFGLSVRLLQIVQAGQEGPVVAQQHLCKFATGVK